MATTQDRMRIGGPSAQGNGPLARVRPAPCVLHVRVVTGQGGGPEKTILRTCGLTDRSQLRAEAAYIHPVGDPGIELIKARAAELGCQLHTIAERGPIDPRTVYALLALCRRLHVTVWHGHDYKSNLLGLMLRPLWSMKLVTTVHGWTRETLRARLYERVDVRCLRRYERVIAVSDSLRDESVAAGVPEKLITVIANGIDTREYRRKRDTATARNELGLDSTARIIGVVGRLSAEKGVDRAIRALVALRQRYSNVELHLIGDGPARSALETLAEELGVSSAVKFHGWQRDTRDWFEAMDVMLLPSRTEGMPNAVLEAMAMETAVAATDVGGVHSLLNQGRCGVVLAGDESSWPGQIEPLLVSGARRQELARRARQRVVAQYDFAGRIEAEMSVYDQLLSLGQVSLRKAA